MVAAERALQDSRWAIEHLARPPDEPLERVLARHAAAIAARTGVAVTFVDLGTSEHVGPEVSEALARILGEAVTNARHGNATLVHVELSTDPLRLRVIDDGTGSTRPRARAGFGLGGMRERAALVGAELSVRSGPGAGTEVAVELPMNAPVAGARGRRPRADPRGRASSGRGRSPVHRRRPGRRRRRTPSRPPCASGPTWRCSTCGCRAAAPPRRGRSPPGCRATRAVMLTVSRSDEDLFAALRAGASGYLLKDMPFEAIADELAGVLEGRVALPPELVARLVEEFRDSAPRRRALLGQGAGAQLTSREWQVLDFLRQGLATNEIARRLFVSPATVRSHVAAVLRKLRVPDRDAAIRAVRGALRGALRRAFRAASSALRATSTARAARAVAAQLAVRGLR